MLRLPRPFFAGTLLLLLALSGCSLRSRFCGNSSEPCCVEGPACEEGLSCQSGNVCLPANCGGEGQTCCPTGCDQGLRCSSDNVCTRPDSTCPSSCTLNERRCTSTPGVEVCVAQGACRSWATLVEKCPADEVCGATAAGFGCTSACPGACVLDSLLCTTEGLKVCALNPSSGCPELQLAPPQPDKPKCETGACDGPFCWENPLPNGNGFRAISGESGTQYYVLDEAGNILRRNGTQYGYEYRPTSGVLRALASCSKSPTAFAVGDNGLVLRRGGGGWMQESLGDPTAQLRAVACDLSGRAFAVGTLGGIYLRATNGLWRKLTSPSTQELYGAALYSFTTIAVAVGANGTLISCNKLDTNPTCTIEGVAVTTETLNAAWADPDSGEMHAVGTGGVVLSRTFGGWQRVAMGLTGQNLLAISGFQDNVYVAGAGGAFLVRLGSQGWFDESFTDKSLTTLFAADGAHLFAAGSGSELWFNDSNGLKGPNPVSRWRVTSGASPNAETVLSLGGTRAGDVYAVGDKGVILHKHGDVWRREAESLSPATMLSGVTAISASEVYVVGADGKILSKRGGSWSLERTEPFVQLNAVWNDGRTVYAVGSGGMWLEKPVGAPSSAWTKVNHGKTTKVLYAITGRRSTNGSASEVWAVGTDCTAIRKSTSGFETVLLPGCTVEDLTSAYESPEGEMLIGGEGGLLLHRVGGVWTRATLSSAQTLLAVTISGTEAYAVGGAGDLFHRTGTVWRQEAARLTHSNLTSLYASPEGDLFVGGARGLIWRRK